MGYLGGFKVTMRKFLKWHRHRARSSPASTSAARAASQGSQARQGRADPRPTRPQPVRGRHGEVHRLRAVRRRLSRPLHLRARRGQRSGRSDVARASGSASSTRSTTCGASTAICAWRPARPRRSPSRSCSSSASPNRADAIYTKAELLVDDDGRPQQLPWEDWREGDDEMTSAWMRATSPGGVGRVRGHRRVVGRARLRRPRSRGRPTARGCAGRDGHSEALAAARAPT